MPRKRKSNKAKVEKEETNSDEHLQASSNARTRSQSQQRGSDQPQGRPLTRAEAKRQGKVVGYTPLIDNSVFEKSLLSISCRSPKTFCFRSSRCFRLDFSCWKNITAVVGSIIPSLSLLSIREKTCCTT